MTRALEGGEWSAARPGRTLSPGKTRYPFYRRLGGPQGRSGWAENLAPPGFDPRTVQPVVSRYTDWATRPTYIYIYIYIWSVCVSVRVCVRVWERETILLQQLKTPSERPKILLNMSGFSVCHLDPTIIATDSNRVFCHSLQAYVGLVSSL